VRVPRRPAGVSDIFFNLLLCCLFFFAASPGSRASLAALALKVGRIATHPCVRLVGGLEARQFFLSLLLRLWCYVPLHMTLTARFR
jgi:hypothetical protein